MSDLDLKKLQEAWKKLDEAESSYKDVDGIKPVKGYGDKDVKAVTDLPKRDEGAQGTDDEQKSGFEGNEAAVEGSNIAPVVRGEGSQEGAKEVGEEHGTEKEIQGSDVKSVTQETGRAEGSADAPKKYNQDFRNRIKSALGLPLNDKLNQTGKGLNKDV